MWGGGSEECVGWGSEECGEEVRSVWGGGSEECVGGGSEEKGGHVGDNYYIIKCTNSRNVQKLLLSSSPTTE